MGHSEKNQEYIRLEIVAAKQSFITDFNRNDAAAVANHYAQEGQLLSENSGVIEGKQAIQAFWQGAFDTGLSSIERSTIEVEGHDDLVFEAGTYLIRGSNEQILDQGKYLMVWKLQGTSWKIHRDIWDSSLPYYG